MYEISVEDSFDAAHCIPGYAGSCERLHGHTYRVSATFRALELDKHGMALDFKVAKQALRDCLQYMDHQYINELPEFLDQNPTAESIARFIFTQMRTVAPSLHRVSVWETANSCATYYEEA